MSRIYRAFTAEDDATMREMFAAGASIGEVAKKLDRKPSSIAHRSQKLAMRDVKPRPRPINFVPSSMSKPIASVKRTMRPCMKCGIAFASSGPGNRLCSLHRQADVSPFEP